MKIIIESDQFIRTLKRMTHEIIEKNEDLSSVILVGIKKKGTPIAKHISKMIESIENIVIPVEEIDINNHRDDGKNIGSSTINFSNNIDDKIIILVDDVLFTGRSVRAAMDALMDLGRPSKIMLAIFIDRGHRELPIRADFIGKNIPTSRKERVICDFEAKQVIIE